jgi:hypothetical protein
VWGVFPRAKAALHGRQHRAILASLPPGSTRLPGARSREHDALALLDEGGVVLLETTRGRVGLVFGHALYEGLVLGVRAMVARAIEARVTEVAASEVAWSAVADGVLERAVGDGIAPEALPRIALADVPLP